MRAYFFTNMYLSSIQKGIQSGHVIHELFTNNTENAYLYEWAREHKTMVVLDAGYQSELIELEKYLRENLVPWGYPVASFREEADSLNGALTCVGCILPEEIYSKEIVQSTEQCLEYPSMGNEDPEEERLSKYVEMHHKIMSYRLAQ